MKVKKAINNNILCAIDKKGNELIVTGKGIGFGKKTGELVDESKIQNIYCMEGKNEQKKLRELVESIPLEHIQLTQELIKHFGQTLGVSLNESLLITLSDHISFALKRKKEGMEFSHPLKDAIMSYYPTEYQLGQYCIGEICRQYHVELIEDEAAFIALHIINAELNTTMRDTLDITRLIDGCIEVVENYYGRSFERQSLDFDRFIVHLRYFASRLFQDRMMEDKEDEQDSSFRQLIMQSCPKHYECAQLIGAYILKEYGKELSQEEKIYLAIHLKRVNG